MQSTNGTMARAAWSLSGGRGGAAAAAVGPHASFLATNARVSSRHKVLPMTKPPWSSNIVCCVAMSAHSRAPFYSFGGTAEASSDASGSGDKRELTLVLVSLLPTPLNLSPFCLEPKAHQEFPVMGCNA